VVHADGTLAAGYFTRISAVTFAGAYQTTLMIYRGTVVVYSSTFWTSEDYGNKPVSTWPENGWARASNIPATGTSRRVVSVSIAAGGDDTVELGVGISLADLLFARDGDDLVIRYKGSETDRLILRGQFSSDADRRVEWLQFADGQAVSLAAVLAASAAQPNLAGGAGADLLAGDGGANSLEGGGGNDVLSGAGGGDALFGGEGDDVLEGGDGADILDGGAHNLRTKDNATVWGDTVRYASAAEAVRIALAGAGTAAVAGAAAGDSISNVEHIVGSNAAGATAWGNAGDHLTGDGGDNRILGLGGDDYLAGGAGEDVLYGGAGSDVLEGGAGDDNLAGGEGDDDLRGGGGGDGAGRRGRQRHAVRRARSGPRPRGSSSMAATGRPALRFGLRFPR
jgi:Ca2+-binding RTX toxin-like protein